MEIEISNLQPKNKATLQPKVFILLFHSVFILDSIKNF